MSFHARLVTLSLRHDLDAVAVRRRIREIAALLGFNGNDQTRIATASSEIARVALHGAAEARAEVAVDEAHDGCLLTVVFRGRGAGFEELKKSIADAGGELESALTAAQRLLDSFAAADDPSGVVVTLTKRLPPNAPSLNATTLARIAAELARGDARNPLAEIEEQNRELLTALGELRERQEELERLNGELEDTNRGVLALYAELDDRAERLREANDLKTKFLSYMSHEFRTPLSSILALSRLLLARIDGELGDEQEKQVALIRDSALDLNSTINDLLDLSKIEAGRLDVRASEVLIADLFSALRGMLRPLVLGTPVSLHFEQRDLSLKMMTDEAKLAQILRNFISNAIKFTKAGEVRVSAERDGEEVVFAVRDSGIGIPPQEHERIFEEFSQLDSPLQRRATGTGLGLPLCRKLARLLGGDVSVESSGTAGSTFRATIPLHFDPVRSR